MELDNPVGKNSGTVDGHIYFTCRAMHGVLVAAKKVAQLDTLPTSAPPSLPAPAAAATSLVNAETRKLTFSKFNTTDESEL